MLLIPTLVLVMTADMPNALKFAYTVFIYVIYFHGK